MVDKVDPSVSLLAFARRFSACSTDDQVNFEKAMAWLKALVVDELAAVEYRDTPIRLHLQLSGARGQPALATLYNDSEGGTQVYLSLYRSVFVRACRAREH